MPPSAAARTYSSQGYCFCKAKATTKMTAIRISSESASSFIFRSAAAFSASHGGQRLAAGGTAGRGSSGPAGLSGRVLGSVFTCMCPA